MPYRANRADVTPNTGNAGFRSVRLPRFFRGKSVFFKEVLMHTKNSPERTSGASTLLSAYGKDDVLLPTMALYYGAETDSQDKIIIVTREEEELPVADKSAAGKE
jgi:hypothetical protein